MSTTEPDLQPRRDRMAVLARAEGKQLRELWGGLGIDPAFEMVRGPETGLATVRGRISGDGAPFNFGDVTVTRASVRLQDGAVGHAYRLGRDQGLPDSAPSSTRWPMTRRWQGDHRQPACGAAAPAFSRAGPARRNRCNEG